MKIGIQKLRDISSGIIQGVDESITPNNSVYLANNLVFDEVLGRAKLRKGTTQMGAQIVDAKSVLGLHQHILAAGTKKMLAVINDSGDANSDVFYSSGGNFTICTGSGINLTKSLKAHFATFLDTTVLVNGTEAITTVDGIAWIATAGNLDVGDMPKGKYVIEWQDKIYIAGVTGNLDRLYYSSTPSIRLTFSDTPTFLAGDTITGDTTGATAYINKKVDTNNFDVIITSGKFDASLDNACTTNGKGGGSGTGNLSSTSDTTLRVSWVDDEYIDIEPEDGAGSITGLAKVPGYILILKERALKRWDGSSTYPDSLVNIGTPSQEAIVQTRQSVFYYNKRGIYETTGGYPRKISRKIQHIIDAIPSTYYSSVSGWGDGENVYYSIGDITLNDLTFNNAVVCYNLNSQTWTMFTFPNEFLCWHHYIDTNGDETIIAGDDDGNVWKVLNGSTDGSSAIKWLLQYNTQEFGSRGRITDISKIVAYSKNVRNGTLYIKSEDKEFEPFGTIKNDVEELINDTNGRYFDIRLMGSGRDDIEIIGLDFPSININENYKD